MKEKLKYLPVTIFLIIVFVIFLKTMLPGQAFHDAGELQVIVPTLNIAHPTGYPTYILLSKILLTFIPVGEVAFKVNFLSIVYSILTLVLIYLILVKLTKDYLFSIIGILILAFVEPFWNYSGIANVHTLHRVFQFLLFFIFLLILEKKNVKLFYILSLVLGLSLGNHLLTIYLVPGFLLGFLAYKGMGFGIKQFFFASLFFVMGILVYIFLPIRELFGPALSYNYSILDWTNFFRHISGSDFKPLLFQGGLDVILENSVNSIDQMVEYLGVLPVILMVLGMIWLFRINTIFESMLFLSAILTVVFSANYLTSDSNRYLLSVISIFCLFIGLGCFFVYQMLCRIFKNDKYLKLILFLIFLSLPLNLFFNNYRKVNKVEDNRAEIYSKEVFSYLEPDSLILTWWNFSPTLWYRREILKERLDIRIVNIDEDQWVKVVLENVSKRPVFMITPNEEVVDRFRVEKVGNIYKVYE